MTQEVPTTPATAAGKEGFTLIELSIVLVIIGLIVGGVLVGQDLIKAAEIRAVVGQLEKLDAATMTFRNKFNGLPGDLTNPATFSLDATGIGTKTGNGLISRGTDTDANDLDTESALFFRHLAQANMVSEPISQADGTKANVDSITATLPLSKMGRGNYISVMNISGLNYMFLAGMTVTDGDVTFTDAITPTEAFQIDTKLDDGVASTGTVIAVTDFVTANGDESGGGAAAGECMGSASAYYTNSTVTANTNGCMLRRRASF